MATKSANPYAALATSKSGKKEYGSTQGAWRNGPPRAAGTSKSTSKPPSTETRWNKTPNNRSRKREPKEKGDTTEKKAVKEAIKRVLNENGFPSDETTKWSDEEVERFNGFIGTAINWISIVFKTIGLSGNIATAGDLREYIDHPDNPIIDGKPVDKKGLIKQLFYYVGCYCLYSIVGEFCTILHDLMIRSANDTSHGYGAGNGAIWTKTHNANFAKKTIEELQKHISMTFTFTRGDKKENYWTCLIASIKSGWWRTGIEQVMLLNAISIPASPEAVEISMIALANKLSSSDVTRADSYHRRAVMMLLLLNEKYRPIVVGKLLDMVQMFNLGKIQNDFLLLEQLAQLLLSVCRERMDEFSQDDNCAGENFFNTNKSSAPTIADMAKVTIDSIKKRLTEFNGEIKELESCIGSNDLAMLKKINELKGELEKKKMSYISLSVFAGALIRHRAEYGCLIDFILMMAQENNQYHHVTGIACMLSTIRGNGKSVTNFSPKTQDKVMVVLGPLARDTSKIGIQARNAIDVLNGKKVSLSDLAKIEETSDESDSADTAFIKEIINNLFNLDSQSTKENNEKVILDCIKRRVPCEKDRYKELFAHPDIIEMIDDAEHYECPDIYKHLKKYGEGIGVEMPCKVTAAVKDVAASVADEVPDNWDE